MFSSAIHTQPLLTFYPVPTPFPFPLYSNLVSDLFPSPSFSSSTNARSHFFSRPPVSDPDSRMYNLFYLYVSQPAREPGFFSPIWHCRTDWSTVRPIGSSHYNIQLLWRRKSVRCVYVCRCVAQEFAVFTGGKPWSVG